MTPAQDFATEFPAEILIAAASEADWEEVVPVFNTLGYAPFRVKTGIEAIDRAYDGGFDYIFLPAELPELTSMEVASFIRNNWKNKGSALPRLIALVSEDDDAANWTETEVMDAVIELPIEAPSLKALIRLMHPQLQASKKAATGSSSEIYDEAILGNFVKNYSAALVIEIINDFRDEFSTLLHEMEASLHENNLLAVKKTAHRLKGAALNIGAKRVGERFRALENEALLLSAEEIQIRIKTLHDLEAYDLPLVIGYIQNGGPL